MILGTIQYMAPEQLEGKEADSRTDIFALGSVLYEMATGRKAFAKASTASLIGAILNEEPPPVSSLQQMAPPALDHVVRRCLAKDPDDRWQSAHDVAAEMKWIAGAGSTAGVGSVSTSGWSRREKLMAWTLAATVIAGAVWVGRTRRTSGTGERVQFAVTASNGSFRLDRASSNAAPAVLSPDGRFIVFGANDTAGSYALWVRPLDSIEARPLPGTKEARSPFWSPDSRSIAFRTGDKLQRIRIEGGSPQVICNESHGSGGAWNSDGVILFPPHWRQPIFRVAAAGGTPEPVTQLDPSRNESAHRQPFFLPDGRHFLFLATRIGAGRDDPANAIYVGSLDSKERKLLVPVLSKPAYALGHLLFARGMTLFAQPFDPTTLSLSGEPASIAEGLFSTSAFSVSENGTLSYQTGSLVQQSQLLWLDRSGKVLGTQGNPDNYKRIALSPDGQRLTALIADPDNNSDVWVEELTRRTRTRLTFDSVDKANVLWSADGRRVIYGSSKAGHLDIYARDASGAGEEETLVTSEDEKWPTGCSRDGQWLTYTRRGTKPDSKFELWAYSFATRQATPLLQTAYDEGEGSFSPDGRWITYGSNETGHGEVYVRPFPGPGGKWQVSSGGGGYSFWSRSGREILFVGDDGGLWSADVTLSALAFGAGPPKRLPPVTYSEAFAFRPAGSTAADGSRFLVAKPTEAPPPLLMVVLNWPSGLKK